MKKTVLTLFLSFIILTMNTSCLGYSQTWLTVRITGVKDLTGASWEAGAFAYDRLDEGILAGDRGIIDSTYVETVLKTPDENLQITPDAEEKNFVRGEQVYIGARIIQGETVWETEFLKYVTVMSEGIVYLSFSEMVEKDTRPLQE